MMVSKLSCDADSIGTSESRTYNLASGKELKRIYHKKMHIIGRDSNGALLSKKELAEIKVNQAKQVAKSVMANDKRKLEHLSKLRPVVRTGG